MIIKNVNVRDKTNLNNKKRECECFITNLGMDFHSTDNIQWGVNIPIYKRLPPLIWKMANPLRGRSLAKVLFLFILDKCILFIYFIKLFCKLLHIYGLRLNILVLLQERRERIECDTWPPPFPKKESKQMNANSLTPCYVGFYIPCSVPTT